MTDELERRFCEHIARREDELVDLLRDLIRFDTTTSAVAPQARQEATLQAYLGDRLRAAGAVVEISEPDPRLVAGHPMIPEEFTLAGRPQLVARFVGTGGGRTLQVNGHVDVVDVEPIAGWAHQPFAGVVADASVHGRGACDIKGGVACMVFAAEVLAGLGVSLAGDLLVNTVTEEKSTGATSRSSRLHSRPRARSDGPPASAGWTTGTTGHPDDRSRDPGNLSRSRRHLPRPHHG